MHRDHRNSAWLSAQHITFLVLSLVNLRLNLASFSPHMMDLWLLFASVWGVGSVLDFGFGVAVVGLVAQSRTTNNREALLALFSTGLIAFALVGLLLVAVGHTIGFAGYFSNPGIVSPEDTGWAYATFALLGASFFFGYLTLFFRALVEGAEAFVDSSRISIANSMLTSVGVFAVFALHLSIVWLAIIYCSLACLQMGAFGIVARRHLHGIRFSFLQFRVHVLKRLFGYGSAVQATTLLGALIDPAVKYVLGVSGIRGLVTVYEIARRFSIAISGLFSATFRNHLPKTSVLSNTEGYRRYLTTEGAQLISTGVAYAAIMFGALTLVPVGLMVFFFGSVDSVPVYSVLAMVEAINICGFMGFLFLLGVGRAHLLILVQGLNLLISTGGLLAGYKLFGTSIGFLAFVVAVSLGNTFILYQIVSLTGLHLREIVTRQTMMRFMTLLLCMLGHFAVLASGRVPLLVTETVYAVTTGLLFRSEFNAAYQMLRRALLDRRSAAEET
jgi:O-antigen/teichoic acid export membrane protein